MANAVAAPQAEALSDRKLVRALRRSERAETTRRRRAAAEAAPPVDSPTASGEGIDLAAALGALDEGGAPDAPAAEPHPVWLQRILQLRQQYPFAPQAALEQLVEDDLGAAVAAGERYDPDPAVRARVSRLERLVGADTNIDDAALEGPTEAPKPRKIRNGKLLSQEEAEEEATGVPTPRQHRIGSVPVAANDEHIEPMVEASYWKNGMLVWANPDLEAEAAERLEREAVLAERAAEEARWRAGANAPLYAALASLGPDAGGAILLALQLLTEAAKDHPSGLGPRFEQCRAELEPFIEEGTADGR